MWGATTGVALFDINLLKTARETYPSTCSPTKPERIVALTLSSVVGGASTELHYSFVSTVKMARRDDNIIHASRRLSDKHNNQPHHSAHQTHISP
jgi:hypothetical protein